MDEIVPQEALESMRQGFVLIIGRHYFIKTKNSNTFICVPRWWEMFSYDDEKYRALSDRIAAECTAKGKMIVEPCYGQLGYAEAATAIVNSGLTKSIVHSCIPLALECPVRGERYFRALLPKDDLLTRPPNPPTIEYDLTGDADHRWFSIVRVPTDSLCWTQWLPVMKITSLAHGRSLEQPNRTKLFDVLNNI